MEATLFKEANQELLRPEYMTEEECGSLPVFTDGKECISKWKLSFKEKLHCLIHGFVQVRIMSGYTQPPIALQAEKSVFEKD